jgi:glycosyltransferase involved in cell wall biosynthesis
MSVALLHDYRESVSMRLYAERLGTALEALGVHVSRVRQPEVFSPALRRLPLVDKLDSYVGRFAMYPRLARRTTADVFHVVDHGQGYLVSSLDPSRTVVTCHDVILLAVAAGRIRADFSPPVATGILRYSIERMRRARRVIAVSEHTKKDLVELAGFEPGLIEVIHGGLNYPFRPEPERRGEIRSRLSLPGTPLVLHVGHTGFYKNVEGCLHVLARLRREGSDAILVRVGPPFSTLQRALAKRLGVEDAVRELGPLAPDQLADVYRAADVLLFPSLYEGFGWPAVEAMASGLPVVASTGGALPEATGGAAALADPEDHAALASHVAKALHDRAFADALRAAGSRHAARFDWDETARRVSNVYREVIR